MEVNGKFYSMWGQFIEKKNEWIGGTIQDFGDSMDRRIMGISGNGPLGESKITDIELRPNGETSAFFEVKGEGGFGCGFSVDHGGITSGEEGWITFSGYGGHKWRIKKPENQSTPEE